MSHYRANPRPATPEYDENDDSTMCSPAPTQFCGHDVQMFLVYFCAVAHFAYGVVMTLLHLALLVPPVNEDAVAGLEGEEGFVELFDLFYSLRIRGTQESSFTALVTFGLHHGNAGGCIIGIIQGVWSLISVFLGICAARASPRMKVWGWTLTLEWLWFVWVQLAKCGAICKYLDMEETEGRRIFPFQNVSPHCGIVVLVHLEHTFLMSLVSGFFLWQVWTYITVVPPPEWNDAPPGQATELATSPLSRQQDPRSRTANVYAR
mmetsp:Transcript_61045/g.163758  ORF Transcript_61045/g.163758 Transcript_61045/m.163758 type:complete len:263 (-) Transcript_61045:147-935(-)